jgi:hypothetical protein
MYQGHLNNITHDIEYLICQPHLALFYKKKGLCREKGAIIKNNMIKINKSNTLKT